MEHKTLEQLQQVADVKPATPILKASEKWRRWGRCLEARAYERMRSLHHLESPIWNLFNRFRSIAGTPFVAAADDPVLVAAGFNKDGSLADALRFFETDAQSVHRIMCYCHQGEDMSARHASYGVLGFASNFYEGR